MVKIAVNHAVCRFGMPQLNIIGYVFRLKVKCRRTGHAHLHGDQSRTPVKGERKQKMHNIRPVSYTHLDVYKRQVIDCFQYAELGSKAVIDITPLTQEDFKFP